MRRLVVSSLTVATLLLCLLQVQVLPADINLANRSTLETILKRGELRVGFTSGFMPFQMTDKKGKYVGFDIDMAEEMAKAMGVKFVPVNTPWESLIPALTANKFDIIMGGMTITQERNLKINFADPYMVVGQTILVASKHEDKVKSYEDLNESKYIVTSGAGTTAEQTIKDLIPKAKYKSFANVGDAALDVVNGKADAFVFDLPYCVVFNAQHPKAKLVFLDRPLTYEPLAWGINKGDPDF
ncbi:MAG TPA: transporter substrate-binding domain-containing protein, partial [Desulfobacterales bacterium]|nr:transporter substrate-binding domain-containing protein [Desulfobacterales bacterium]